MHWDNAQTTNMIPGGMVTYSLHTWDLQLGRLVPLDHTMDNPLMARLRVNPHGMTVAWIWMVQTVNAGLSQYFCSMFHG